MSEKRDFHLGTILSITDGRFLAPNGIGDLYDILNFMTGDNLFTHQLPRASRECKPWLLRQHPFLESGEMQSALAELTLLLATADGKADPGPLVVGWLSDLTDRYGETFPVEPIPMDDHDVIDPLAELRSMVPAEKIIVVTPDTEDEDDPARPE